MKTVIAAAITFVLGIGATLLFQYKYLNGDESKVVYAMLGEKKILGEQVLPELKEELRQLERAKYEAKKRAVRELFRKDQAPPVDVAVSEPTQAELEEFLKQRGLTFKKLTAQQQKDAVGNFKIFKQMLAAKAAEEQSFSKLDIKWTIPMTFLDPPKKVEVGSLPAFMKKSGGKDVVIFANYHCPFCPNAFQKMKTLQEKMKDQFNLYFRFALNEMPGSIAYQSALASICAAEQDKFPALFNILNAGPVLDSNTLTRAVADAQIDPTKYDACMKSESAISRLKKDMDAAVSVGFDGRPLILINGIKLETQEPDDLIENVIRL